MRSNIFSCHLTQHKLRVEKYISLSQKNHINVDKIHNALVKGISSFNVDRKCWFVYDNHYTLVIRL